MKAALLVVVLLSLAACPKPTPGTDGPRPPVACAVKAVEGCAPQVLGLVNECLAAEGDTVPCLLGVTKIVGCATWEIIACVVRHEGDAAARASARNPNDLVDHRRAIRAQDFLDRTGARFTD